MAETYLQFVIGLFVIDSFGQDGFDPLAQVRNQELEGEFWFHIGACFAYSSHSVGKKHIFCKYFKHQISKDMVILHCPSDRGLEDSRVDITLDLVEDNQKCRPRDTSHQFLECV